MVYNINVELQISQSNKQQPTNQQNGEDKKSEPTNQESTTRSHD